MGNTPFCRALVEGAQVCVTNAVGLFWQNVGLFWQNVEAVEHGQCSILLGTCRGGTGSCDDSGPRIYGTFGTMYGPLNTVNTPFCRALEVSTCCMVHCNTLQHTATHCNTLQHTATHCNTLEVSTYTRLLCLQV